MLYLLVHGIWILTPVEFVLQTSNARGNVSKLAGTFQTELKLPIFLEFPSYVQFMQWNSLTFSASSLFLTKISCFPSFLPLEDSEQPRKGSAVWFFETRASHKLGLFSFLFGQKKTTGKLEQNWFIDGQPACYNFFQVIWKQLKNRTHNPKKNISFCGSQIMHTLLAITCQMTMQKCFHMGNLKECGVTTKLKLRRNEAWCCYSYACRIVPDIWFVRHQGAFVRCKICTSYQMRILSLAVLKNASNWKCCVSTEDHWPIF